MYVPSLWVKTQDTLKIPSEGRLKSRMGGYHFLLIVTGIVPYVDVWQTGFSIYCIFFNTGKLQNKSTKKFEKKNTNKQFQEAQYLRSLLRLTYRKRWKDTKQPLEKRSIG